MGVETNSQWVVPQGHELRRINATLLLLQMGGIVITFQGLHTTQGDCDTEVLKQPVDWFLSHRGLSRVN